MRAGRLAGGVRQDTTNARMLAEKMDYALYGDLAERMDLVRLYLQRQHLQFLESSASEESRAEIGRLKRKVSTAFLRFSAEPDFYERMVKIARFANERRGSVDPLGYKVLSAIHDLWLTPEPEGRSKKYPYTTAARVIAHMRILDVSRGAATAEYDERVIRRVIARLFPKGGTIELF